MASGPSTLDGVLSRHGVTRNDLEQKFPTDDYRLEIAELLGDDWQMLGYYLGFKANEISDIKANNGNEELRRVALLDAWEQRLGKGATYLKLADALYRRKRVDLVEKLCENVRPARSRGSNGMNQHIY